MSKSKITTIYRIVDKHNRGMYNSTKFSIPVNQTHNRQCTPYTDEKLKNHFNLYFKSFPADFFFAFKNKKQAKEWLKYEDLIEELHIRGFKLLRLKCRQTGVVHGTFQTVFKKSAIVDRREISLLELKK